MIVADTNLIAYFIIPGPNVALAQKVLRKDSVWAAPLLWRSEFRNILALYLRQGHIGLPAALQYMEEAELLLAGNESEVDSAPVLAAANSSGCTAYDCEFVHVAQSLGVPLVTSDKKLLREFSQVAVSPEDFVR
ncbi:MAG TPA: type II toxin-antitoxin system VapC family toxin [Longimicrobium sp.]|nr:type II toxin-antitoxin system VapC family toxin [Longimicrobium sp.]